MNQDLHVRKIMLEVTQLLANCYSLEELKSAPYTQNGTPRKHSHIHHPISKWVKQGSHNFIWTLGHAIALSDEFEYRFGKRHFCDSFVKWCAYNEFPIKNSVETEQPQCFKAYPNCIVPSNPVAGYRNYYNEAKQFFMVRDKVVKATWTKRDIPSWFIPMT